MTLILKGISNIPFLNHRDPLKFPKGDLGIPFSERPRSLLEFEQTADPLYERIRFPTHASAHFIAHL
jgi:hypothetical protein